MRWDVGRLVNLSSETVPGLIFAERPFLPPYVPLDEDTPVAPQDPYGFGKHVIEQWCDAAVRRSDISIVSIRPSWVQHPGNYERNVGPMVRQPFEFSPPSGPTRTTTTWPTAIRLAAEVELGHEVVYVARRTHGPATDRADGAGAARRRHRGATHQPAPETRRKSIRARLSACSGGSPPDWRRARRGRPAPLSAHRRVATSASWRARLTAYSRWSASRSSSSPSHPDQAVGTEAGRHRDRRAARQADRLVQTGLDPRGHRGHRALVVRALADDGELVAAHPGGQIGGAHPLGQAPGDLHEDLVAGLVAVGVVDRLERVEVHHHQADGLPGPRGAGQRLVQPGGEGPAVGQPGERVVEGVVEDLGLELAALGHVPNVQDVAGAADRAADLGLDVADRAPHVVHPMGDRHPGGQVTLLHGPQHHPAVIGVEQVEDVGADQLLGAVAVDGEGGPVEEGERAVLVEQPDDVQGALQHRGQHRLARGELVRQRPPVAVAGPQCRGHADDDGNHRRGQQVEHGHDGLPRARSATAAGSLPVGSAGEELKRPDPGHRGIRRARVGPSARGDGGATVDDSG